MLYSKSKCKCYYDLLYYSESMKARASRNAREAFRTERTRTQLFDSATGIDHGESGDARGRGDHEQPAIFRGTLKGYQLKGMNWLANLYDQASVTFLLPCTPRFFKYDFYM